MTDKLRTPADALRDPRPGDVVRKGNLRREVSDRIGDTVNYLPGDLVIERQCWITTWQNWMRNAEVLHVAQEGGE